MRKCVFCKYNYFQLYDDFQVYRYKILDAQLVPSARVSVLPTWSANGDVPKSTDPPLVEAPYGAVEFSLWKEIGEEFLLASSGETFLLNVNHDEISLETELVFVQQIYIFHFFLDTQIQFSCSQSPRFTRVLK